VSVIEQKLQQALRHHEAGRLGEAEDLYRQILRVDPQQPDALHLLGVIALQVGKAAAAIELLQWAVRLQPRVAPFYGNLASAYDAAGRFDEAVATYRRAVQIDPNYADGHYNLATVFQHRGRFDEAIAGFRLVLKLDPGYVNAYHNLGICLAELERFDEAIECFRRTLELAPDHAAAHANVGNALATMGRFDEAAECFRRALELDPDDVTAISGLAAHYEADNQLEEANQLVERGLPLSPSHAQLNLVAAKCERRRGKLAEARRRLERLRAGRLSPRQTKGVLFELGRIYDRLKQCDEAFDCFVEANRLGAEADPQHVQEGREYLHKVQLMRQAFNAEWVASWTPAPPADEAHTPAFLVGFPRSGTTLLDQILDCHPAIETLEEKPLAHALNQAVGEMGPGFRSVVGNLTAEQFLFLRDVYYRGAEEFTTLKPDIQLVDRHAMNTVHVGLLARIFPQARFVMLLRHPCDVCLSCFMQDFRVGGAMGNFFSLEGAAGLYAEIMGLWEQYVELLPMRVLTVRYEELVDDFEGQTSSILDFLGLPWDDAVRRHAEHARQRGRINTASYHQVVEPIYRRARFRWRRYARQLEPILPVLGPLAERLGYEI